MVNHRDKKVPRNFRSRPPCKEELDFFIADEVELSSFRDEMASMEHPFFALKGGNRDTKRYKNAHATIVIAPNAEYGMATVFDKDVWIYSISKLQEAINKHELISRTICFTPYDFFVTTNRDRGGKSYKELEKSLDRLAGTRITTNIIYSGEKQESIGFGLIDSWRIFDEKKGS